MLKEPNVHNQYESPRWGFYNYSEIINGRVAMIALLFIVFYEVISKKTIISLISLASMIA